MSPNKIHFQNGHGSFELGITYFWCFLCMFQYDPFKYLNSYKKSLKNFKIIYSTFLLFFYYKINSVMHYSFKQVHALKMLVWGQFLAFNNTKDSFLKVYTVFKSPIQLKSTSLVYAFVCNDFTVCKYIYFLIYIIISIRH